MSFKVSTNIVITDDRIVQTVTGNTASRPGSPTTGMIYYNTETGVVEVYNGSTWKPAISSVSGDPNAWSWGAGGGGALGTNNTTNRSSPVSVVGGFTDWVQVSAGNDHTIAVRANGLAWAWGTAYSGKLGDNSLVNKSSPVSVVGGFTDWTQVNSGYQHSLGVRANGSAWAWGDGGDGRLGDNTTVDKSSPVSVVGGFTDWVQVSAGYRHSMGVRADGSAWAWGDGGSGKLGNSSTIDRPSPVSVVGGFTDWIQVSAGRYHSAAIRANGSAWAWGLNSDGSLGTNNTTNRSSPVSVVGGFTDWTGIVAGFGSQSTLGIRANGSAWGWGTNTAAQLGINTITNVSSPVSVVGGFTDWIQIETTELHSLGVRANGSAWSWGNNTNGKLGTNNTTSTSSPVSVVGGFTDWVIVTVGFDHTVAIRAG